MRLLPRCRHQLTETRCAVAHTANFEPLQQISLVLLINSDAAFDDPVGELSLVALLIKTTIKRSRRVRHHFRTDSSASTFYDSHAAILGHQKHVNRQHTRSACCNARMHVLVNIASEGRHRLHACTHAHRPRLAARSARALLQACKSLLDRTHPCLAEQQMMSRWAPGKQLMMVFAGLLLMVAAVAPAAAQQPATVQPVSGTSSTTVQKHPFNGLDVR